MRFSESLNNIHMSRFNIAMLAPIPCADPESYVRGGLTTFFIVDVVMNERREERGFKYCYKQASISPSAKRHLNGVSLAGQWWPNIEFWLGSFMIVQGIRTSITKKPYIFVIFQWGGGAPSSPLWIRS